MASRGRYSSILGRVSFQASPQPTYVCARCRYQTSNPNRKVNRTLQSTPSSRRNASSSTFSERLRKRIWGTSSPPGADNPYGAPGVFEQQRQDKKERNSEQSIVQTEPPPTSAQNDAEDEGVEYQESEATTWEGMPTVGGPDWGLEEWDERNPFRGYMVNPRPETREEIISIIHRALVEVMTLRQANLSLEIDEDTFEAPDDYKYLVSQGARFITAADGHTNLHLESNELQQSIVEFIQPEELVIEEEGTSEHESVAGENPEEEQEGMASDSTNPRDSSALAEGVDETEDLISEQTEFSPDDEDSLDSQVDSSAFLPADDSWRLVSLTDPEIKFAVLRRVMQLTGRRIPDPDIESIKDARALLVHLVKKPKPKKLAETLYANETIDLPNVEIRERRYTPIDKEKEIGRWKVIERGLEARGLPVTGKGTVAVGDPIV